MAILRFQALTPGGFASSTRDRSNLIRVISRAYLTGSAQRAQRAYTEEFYQVYDCPWTVPELNTELKNWEYTYNCLRPHQALQYKTPLQFLKDNGIVVKYPSPQSHM